MIAVLLKAGKTKILAASAVLVLLTVWLDWVVGRNVSFAALYILPMMLGAVVLRPRKRQRPLCSVLISAPIST